MFHSKQSRADAKRLQKKRDAERKERHAKELEDLRRRQQIEHEEHLRKMAEEKARKAAEEEAARLAEEKARADALAAVHKRLDDEAKTQKRRTKLLVKNTPTAIAGSRDGAKTQVKKAKSDIKKTTTLQKRIKNMTSETVDQIIDSINKLNLTRFKAEIANAFKEVRNINRNIESLTSCRPASHRA